MKELGGFDHDFFLSFCLLFTATNVAPQFSRFTYMAISATVFSCLHTNQHW